jgi:hypothetical protein
MNGLRIVASVTLLGLGVMALRLPNGASEAVRLRTHFAVVERELLARDVSALTPAQRAARAVQVGLLRRYAAEGKFPRNEYLPGRRPFFRDARGNLCAMAFLIAASGRGDLVDHVARTRNNAYVPELADEPGLAEWLDRHGLTLAEAARIQPTYGNHNEHEVGTAYVATSLGFGAVSVVSIIWNARSMSRLAEHSTRGLIGVAAGATNLGLGLVYIVGDNGGRETKQVAGFANTVVGTTALALGIRALVAKPRAAASRSARLTLTPVATSGVRPSFGFAGNFRF